MLYFAYECSYTLVLKVKVPMMFVECNSVICTIEILKIFTIIGLWIPLLVI